MPQVPLWQAVLRCRCPLCGEGRPHHGILWLRPACKVCGPAIMEFDIGDGAALAVILVLGTLVMVGVFWVDHFNPPAWVHAVAWPMAMTLATLLMMRPPKAALVNQRHRHRATETGL